MSNNELKKVIVRGDRSGVFFGELVSCTGQEVKLHNCRRIWYWAGACSISELAMRGVTKPNECKFTCYVTEIEILDAVEIIPCMQEAIDCIEAVPEWSMRTL